MTSGHPRSLIGCCLALLLAVLCAAPAAAQAIAGTDLEAEELVAELPWAFEVTSEVIEPGSG